MLPSHVILTSTSRDPDAVQGGRAGGRHGTHAQSSRRSQQILLCGNGSHHVGSGNCQGGVAECRSVHVQFAGRREVSSLDVTTSSDAGQRKLGVCVYGRPAARVGNRCHHILSSHEQRTANDGASAAQDAATQQHGASII